MNSEKHKIPSLADTFGLLGLPEDTDPAALTEAQITAAMAKAAELGPSVFSIVAGGLLFALKDHAELANKDRLTQVFNRRYFDIEFGRVIARAARHPDSKVIFALVDLDYFKQFNDTHGHQADDAALRAATQRLKGCVREIDTVARYGGEELAVIIEIKDGIDPQDVLERLEQEMCSFSVAHAGKVLDVGSSIGVYVADAQEAKQLGPESMIEKADFLLYRAKQEGRGRLLSNHTPSVPQHSAEIVQFPVRARA